MYWITYQDYQDCAQEASNLGRECGKDSVMALREETMRTVVGSISTAVQKFVSRQKGILSCVENAQMDTTTQSRGSKVTLWQCSV